MSMTQPSHAQPTPEESKKRAKPQAETRSEKAEAAQSAMAATASPDKTDKEDAAAKANENNRLVAQLRFQKDAADRKAAALQQKLNALVTHVTTPTPPEPDKNADKTAWLEWQARQHQSQIAALKQWQLAQEQQQKRDEIRKRLAGVERDYSKTNPDYPAAMNHAKALYAEELQQKHPDHSAEAIDQAVEDAIIHHTITSVNRGEHPAEALYATAQKRFGWQKPTADDAADTHLQQVQQNQKRSMSALAGGGRTSALPLSKAGIANMTVAEFSKLTPRQLASLERAAG